MEQQKKYDVASKVEFLKSKWVKYEWSTFCNDLKSNYRTYLKMILH